MHKISPFLWFDQQAEPAANFYVSIFKDSRIVGLTRCSEAGPGPAGSVLTVSFELAGQSFVALNGGPRFKFNEAVSFSVDCETQEEVDYYWSKLTSGGQESQCGWLQDKFGVSWQVIPGTLGRYLADPDQQRAARVIGAMLRMKKIDIAALERAYHAA
jgi:predicted 3-demethylubiquinone-9 3-methyltransferase (glyoxalase superfamily)